jgi:hypothetical protein
VKNALTVAAIAASVVSCACADTILYQNDFEGRALGSEWSAGSRLNNEVYSPFTKFNGRYNNSSTSLTLNALPVLRPMSGDQGGGDGGGGGGGGGTGSPSWYEISVAFDFYCIDSWDGNENVYGPDAFRMSVNGQRIFRSTFSNHPTVPDNFPEDPVLVNYGFGRWRDSIYRQITATYQTYGGDQMVIRWGDEGLQSMGDESWGIDNVRVTARVVPAPGATGVLALATLVVHRRRRA